MRQTLRKILKAGPDKSGKYPGPYIEGYYKDAGILTSEEE